MRPNKIRELLDADKPSVATHIHSSWPSVVEIAGHTGMFDYIEFVSEYAPFDLHDLENICRAAELHNMSSMIKVDQEPRKFLSQRAVGAGFQSVLFADCRTAADAEECVKAVRPETPEDEGTHGVGTRRFTYMLYGGTQEYVDALRNVVVALMIEKKTAVENLDEVLSVPGIDMIQWGPADYVMSIGRPGEWFEPDIKELEKKVIATALKNGVAPRAEIESPDQAKYYMDLGVKHFCISTDVMLLYKSWMEKGEALRKVIEG